ncbi:MAG: replication-associated recombination protein A [Spirochaetota bacterium]|nr:MAG: replication-associated recombination protein A [Spirochaetota bacterium]
MNDISRPLANRLTPEIIDDFFGQKKIMGKNGVLRLLIEQDKVTSSIFYGPAGSGKTALAMIIAHRTKSDIQKLNAVVAKVEDLRNALFKAEQNLRNGKKTILFIDEIHRFNKLQQDGLLPAVEEGTITLIGTTTHNPFYSLIPPLRSRVLLFEFEKLDHSALEQILIRAEQKESISITKEAREYLLKFANGDARRMLNLLETVLLLEKKGEVELENIEKVIKEQHLVYDRDEDFHFDAISAFIKSIRGSDPDAALYWLALMLEGGEDPLYIARRLVILASEDIGLSDPLSLPIAQAAYDTVERIGMPEARITLAHVSIYLSLQPKSNSSYLAIDKAQKYVKTHEQIRVPAHLRSSSPGGEYKYPHDYKFHFVPQEYLGKNVQFYSPGSLGDEKELKKRLEFLKKLKQQGEE